MTIGLVYDLRDDYLAEGFSEEQVAEFDSAATITILEQTLRSLGYTTERIGNGLALARQLACGKRWDLVFNIAEGLHGRSREAQVPALLEMYGIACTFSDALVCALTLDKAMTKRVVQSAGLYTPRFSVVASPEDLRSVDLEFPLFAKPLAEGTVLARVVGRRGLDPDIEVAGGARHAVHGHRVRADNHETRAFRQKRPQQVEEVFVHGRRSASSFAPCNLNEMGASWRA